MDNKSEMKVRDILKKCLNLDINSSEINFDESFEKYGINSITIIKVIVEIEKEFNVQFSNEELDFNQYKNIRNIILNLEKKLQ